MVLIIISYCLILVTILVFFLLKMKTLKNRHSQKMASLRGDFSLNKRQLLFREKNLDTYNFLKYNLSEALRPQFDIEI